MNKRLLLALLNRIDEVNDKINKLFEKDNWADISDNANLCKTLNDKYKADIAALGYEIYKNKEEFIKLLNGDKQDVKDY